MIILEVLLQIAMYAAALLVAVVVCGVVGYLGSILMCEIRERWFKK